MSYHALSDTEVKARKQHFCDWCGETILVGETHKRAVGIFEGDFQSMRFHLECVDPCNECCCENDGLFEARALENKRPAKEAK